MPGLPEHALYAVRYATRAARRRDHFIGGDPHDAPMPMDYFIWVAVGEAGAVVIDTGFTAAVARRRGREHLRCPIEALALIGVDPSAVRDVIVSHLHYDHAGNFAYFPNARFHIQEREMHFVAGRHMRHSGIGHGYEPDDVCEMIRLNFGGRVIQYRGDAEIAPGLRVHRTGGHTDGLQFATVHTRRGWVAIASDASHFYENFAGYRPFTRAFHVGDMMAAFDRLRELTPSPDSIVPGHDPLVMRRYPAPSPELEGIVVRLDVEPQPSPSNRDIP
jgi:glyoxylase-like metal-dependent hydrolase (beta-lactamase superfamily II)